MLFHMEKLLLKGNILVIKQWERRGGKVKGARILRCAKVLSEIGDGQKREHSMAHKVLAIQLDTIASFPASGRLGEADSMLMDLELETISKNARTWR